MDDLSWPLKHGRDTHIGFTGTKEGMNDFQKIHVAAWLREFMLESQATTEVWFHHGDLGRLYMTHPLVSAFHNSKTIQGNLQKVNVRKHFDQLKSAFQRNLTLIDEVMAATPEISCYVGIFCGHNHKPMMIWIWPLNEVTTYYYWVEDCSYNRLDEGVKSPIRIVLPFCLRS